MKLKLKQKIAIQLYKTKFKAISIVSQKRAAESLFTLFCTPYSGKPKRKEPPFFKRAITLNFVYEGLTVRGWQWTPIHGNNRKILVVHGFDSCSYKSESIIQKLYTSGFQVLAFDAIAHGISDGKTINAKQYAECIAQIQATFGSMYAIVAHSLGGLATSIAVEESIHNLEKLVLIAPATETRRAIDNFFAFLKMPLWLKPEFETLIKKISGKEINYFSVSRIIKNINTQTLWVHDSGDFICPIDDVKPVIELQLPHLQFKITHGLGHNAVYRNADVLQQIASFLNA